MAKKKITPKKKVAPKKVAAKKITPKAKKKIVEKPTKSVAKKASKVNWDKLPAEVTIVGLEKGTLIKGREYPNTGKSTAYILVEKGFAKLK